MPMPRKYVLDRQLVFRSQGEEKNPVPPRNGRVWSTLFCEIDPDFSRKFDGPEAILDLLDHVENLGQRVTLEDKWMLLDVYGRLPKRQAEALMEKRYGMKPNPRAKTPKVEHQYSKWCL